MAITSENRKQKTENRKCSCISDLRPPTSDLQSGFALLIAVIFMSVMLAFGLALASLGYKQQVLASASVESQYAFYAADAALECALYADQQQSLFAYPQSDPPSVPTITCGGAGMISSSKTWSATQWTVTNRLSFGGSRCADVTVYKYANGTTYLFAQGYDVSCTTVTTPNGARFVARGLKAQY